jgi:integrase
MVQRVKLTSKRVTDFDCPPGKQQDFLHDSLVPGLAVRATRGSPIKSYVFRYRLRGETPRLTIGDVRAWNIESSDPQRPGAREEARRLQGLVDRGIDPRAEKIERATAAAAQSAEAVRRQVTLVRAWADYIAARRLGWGARHLADHTNLARTGGSPWKRGERMRNAGPLASLMGCRLSDLDAERVKSWLRDEVSARPTQTRLAFSALRAFVNWCADTPAYCGIVDPAIFEGRGVRDLLPKKGAKKDCLQREQLRAWFAAVRGLDNPTASAYLQVLLLTGARREELAALKWANVDFKWQSLTIHDKVEGERTIPLTPYVAELLRNLKARNVRPLRLPPGEEWEPIPWAFASPTAKSGRIADPRLPHTRALRGAGIEGLTLHGLRRSFGTLAEWVEAPAGIVAQIQGHKPSATAEKHYRARPLDLLRLWHTRVEAWILQEANIEFEAQGPATTKLHSIETAH